MLRRLAAVTTASLMLAGSILPAAAPPPHPALARGLALMRDGDFEAAVLELDAAARKIESDPAAERHRPWAYVYLGVAYLELEQEARRAGQVPRGAGARSRAAAGAGGFLRAVDPRVRGRARGGGRRRISARAPSAAAPAIAGPGQKKGSKGPLVAVPRGRRGGGGRGGGARGRR